MTRRVGSYEVTETATNYAQGDSPEAPEGAALSRIAKSINNLQEQGGVPVLTLPKSEGLSTQKGMRTSLEGTQARWEAESHSQVADVAEVNSGEPVHGKLAYQIMHEPSSGERFGVAPF